MPKKAKSAIEAKIAKNMAARPQAGAAPTDGIDLWAVLLTKMGLLFADFWNTHRTLDSNESGIGHHLVLFLALNV